MSSLKVKLIVSGKFEPDTITRELGVTPTKVLRVGEPFSPKIPKLATENRWEYTQHSEDAEEGLDKYVSSLISHFSETASNFKSISNHEGISCTILCSYDIESGGVEPSIFLSHETIALLAELGCDIDVDIIRY